jgi:hypothetical protein
MIPPEIKGNGSKRSIVIWNFTPPKTEIFTIAAETDASRVTVPVRVIIGLSTPSKVSFRPKLSKAFRGFCSSIASRIPFVSSTNPTTAVAVNSKPTASSRVGGVYNTMMSLYSKANVISGGVKSMSPYKKINRLLG